MTADVDRDQIARLLITMDAHTGDRRPHEARDLMEAWVRTIDLGQIFAALPAAPAGVTLHVVESMVGCIRETLVPNGPGADRTPVDPHGPYSGPRGEVAPA